MTLSKLPPELALLVGMSNLPGSESVFSDAIRELIAEARDDGAIDPDVAERVMAVHRKLAGAREDTRLRTTFIKFAGQYVNVAAIERLWVHGVWVAADKQVRWQVRIHLNGGYCVESENVHEDQSSANSELKATYDAIVQVQQHRG